MLRNVEIKARVQSPARVQRLVEAIADQGPTRLDQTDTFFRCAEGRLKLREAAGGGAELIYYRRRDADQPRESAFQVAPVSDPAALKDLLGAALGALGVVVKRRQLYRIGQTRVHLDRVEGLGDFIELEVMLRPDQTTDQGIAIATELMQSLEIDSRRLERLAYFDLLQGRSV